MAKRSRRPQLESLEGRVALSGGNVTALAQHHIALNGSVSGPYSAAMGIPDVGISQTLTGSGKVAPLGQVSASGTISTPGFIAHGRTTGIVTFTNASGSVTIRLTGPLQSAGAAIPRNFAFRIIAATGKYAGDTDTGTATLTEVQAASTVQPAMTGNLPIIVGPIFGLTLHSS